jgi:hypothetical protein
MSVNHLSRHCERFGSERHRLIYALSELDVLHGTLVRDLCDLKTGFDLTFSSGWRSTATL